jgi:ribosome-associated protein
MSGLMVGRALFIPEAELEESFIRASGPGGQNVNKVASAVQLRFDVGRSRSLPEPVRARLLALADSRLDANGILTISARRFREQARNRDDARARLSQLLLSAMKGKKPRLATKPSLASRRRRSEAKKHRGRIKKARGRPDLD